MDHVVVRSAFIAASALLLAVAPAGAARAADARGVAGEAASLLPGEFVWQPGRSETGAVEIVVSLPLQRAYVYRGGTLIGVSTVSTGRQGHSTPVGRFDILEKRQQHYSNLYNGAPMPFMQRLTWGGVALHAGQISGRPASHGCIRLPLAFARLLFAVTEVGAAVHVVEDAPAPGEALAMVRASAVEGLRRALAPAQRPDERPIDPRKDWRVASWQSRFAAAVGEAPQICERDAEWDAVPAGPPARWRRPGGRARRGPAQDAGADVAALHVRLDDWRGSLAAGADGAERAGRLL